jgi:hypothetical protein
VTTIKDGSAMHSGPAVNDGHRERSRTLSPVPDHGASPLESGDRVGVGGMFRTRDPGSSPHIRIKHRTPCPGPAPVVTQSEATDCRERPWTSSPGTALVLTQSEATDCRERPWTLCPGPAP